MVIEKICIKRFRGIDSGAIDGLRRFTLLVGKNGSGKSSVLETLYLASAYAAPEDPLRKISKLDYLVQRRGGRGAWESDRRFLWHNASTSEPIVVELETERGGVAFEVLDLPKGERPIRLTHDDEGVARELGRTLFIDRSLLSNPAVVEPRAWLATQAEGLDRVVLHALRDAFEPDAEDVYCMPDGDGCRLVVNVAGTPMPLDEMGDGAKSAALTLLSLAHKPSALLLEEPELHLHPAALYVFIKALAELSKRLDFQVIATTHSVELIHITSSKEVGADASVVYLERVNGTLDARVLSAEEATLLAKIGIDPRFLYVF